MKTEKSIKYMGFMMNVLESMGMRWFGNISQMCLGICLWWHWWRIQYVALFPIDFLHSWWFVTCD